MTFQDLEPVHGTDCRLMGTTLISEEEFNVCQFHEYNGTWRATLQGLQAYSKLLARRRQERKSAWQTRVERDEEWSEQMNALIEEEGP